MHQARALLAPELRIVQHPLLLFGGDDGAELNRRVSGIADAYGCGFCRQLFHEFVVYTLLHNVAAGADAGLAGTDEGTERRVIDSLINVEIVEHQNRRLAAEFQ